MKRSIKRQIKVDDYIFLNERLTYISKIKDEYIYNKDEYNITTIKDEYNLYKLIDNTFYKYELEKFMLLFNKRIYKPNIKKAEMIKDVIKYYEEKEI